jgi:hypothetical protein
MTHIELLAQEISVLKESEIDELADLLVDNSSRRADRLQSAIGWVLFDKEQRAEQESESANAES